MFGWQVAVVIGVILVVFLLAAPLTLALLRYYSSSRHRNRVTQAIPPPPPPRGQTRTALTSREIAEILESLGISGADNTTKTTKSSNFSLFRRGHTTKPFFSWSDHPSLITDAFENGWSRFGFTGYTNSGSTRSSLLGLVGELQNSQHQRETPVEIGWEIGDGSDDFMQRVRLNSGFRKIAMGNGCGPVSASSSSSSSSVVAVRSSIRTALPLPGPSVGNSFPQEAYFEIMIVSIFGSSYGYDEGDKVKLIRVSNSVGSSSVSDNNKGYKNGSVRSLEEVKLGSRGGGGGGGGGGDKGGGGQQVLLSLGLATASFNPNKIPGTYRGSVGFNSNGSLNLDGMKLVYESEKFDWGQESKTIGLGYDPRHKRVFYTVDGELIHVINCKSEEFETPLYPILAANADITVMINMGQSKFRYDSANETRTPNPCLVRSSNTSALGHEYENSGELFSMGRIDPSWLNNHTARSGGNNYGYSVGRSGEVEESGDEGDFFEIALDVNSDTDSIMRV